MSVGGEGNSYLCMSSDIHGARTLNSKASDVIFRVNTSSLNRDNWKTIGAVI